MIGDPRAPFRAAPLFGDLVARGLLEPNETLETLLAAATRAAPMRDRTGMGIRLAHLLRDTTADTQRRIAAAEGRVIRALRPLLAAWADPADIRRAAAAANGGTLLAPELARLIDALVRERIG